MTVIVGVEGKDGACVAADSFYGNYSSYRKNSSKLFTREADDSHVIFGITGDSRWGQILKYRLHTPEIDYDDLDRFMAVDFSDALRSTAEDAGYLKKVKGQDQGGHALLGVGGFIYCVFGRFEVVRAKQYDAVGYGAEMAMGALYSLFEEYMGREQTEEVAKKSVESVCYHSPFCTEPVKTFWVSKHE